MSHGVDIDVCPLKAGITATRPRDAKVPHMNISNVSNLPPSCREAGWPHPSLKAGQCALQVHKPFLPAAWFKHKQPDHCCAFQ